MRNSILLILIAAFGCASVEPNDGIRIAGRTKVLITCTTEKFLGTYAELPVPDPNSEELVIILLDPNKETRGQLIEVVTCSTEVSSDGITENMTTVVVDVLKAIINIPNMIWGGIWAVIP